METTDFSIHQYPYRILFEKEAGSVTFVQRLKRVFKEIKKENPEIINITGYYDMAVVLPALWFRKKGVRLVMSIDSTLNESKPGRVSYFLKKWILNKMDGFFSYGSKTTELIMNFSIDKKKVLLENNAVDNERLKNTFEEYKSSQEYQIKSNSFPAKNFIFVGRLIAEKNVKELIRNFAKIEDREWGLILVGTGPLKEQLMADSKNISNVFFEDPKPWHEVPKMLAHANVLVLPSISEPWGLVVNEAMACGLPVIVSEACGSAHDLVIEGINGFRFDPFEGEDLLNKLQWCVNNADYLQKMGKESQKLITSHSPTLLAKQMFDGFKALTR